MVRPMRLPNQKGVVRRINETIAAKPTEGYHVNRNPRNLEFLRIAYKNRGYGLDAPFSKDANYWHKLVLTPSGKFITAQLIHFENGVVLEASTKEWCIKQQLFKTSDTAAYVNLARVFADRCLQTGILEMQLKPSHGPKFEKFVDVLKESGISLKEPKDMSMFVSKMVNKWKGRRMQPEDWKEIVENH